MKPNTTKQTIQAEGNLPPSAVDVEEAVLGVFMLIPNSLIHVPMLNNESFYKLEHQIIFNSIVELINKGQKVDILTVTMELKRSKQLTNVGGPGYIARLTNKIASDTNLENYCHILIECETARRQIIFGSELIRKAYDQSEDVFKTNEFMADQVHAISTRSVLTKEIRNEDLANAMIDRIHKASQTRGITGVPTGFSEHDKLLGGLQPSDLIILAARPSMGKTALALCYLRNAVVEHGKRMIFFSLEMSADQLFQRLTAIHMNLSANKFKQGDMSPGEWNYFNENLQPLLTKDLIIVDDCQTLSQITMRAKKERMSGRLDGIIIDYLQLIEIPGIKNREQEVSTISRNLKLLAKDMHIPVLALSQLSRAVESRSNKRPMLSDLRESGSIEQDADVVEFLYRPNYYNDAPDGDEDAAYVCVEKHRNGELQDIRLRYIHQLTKFIDNDKELDF
jgi:replicative DNA helicase